MVLSVNFCLISPFPKKMMIYPLLKYYFLTPVSNIIYLLPSEYVLVNFFYELFLNVCTFILDLHFIKDRYFKY
jgi:hypothetical protein